MVENVLYPLINLHFDAKAIFDKHASESYGILYVVHVITYMCSKYGKT